MVGLSPSITNKNQAPEVVTYWQILTLVVQDLLTRSPKSFFMQYRAGPSGGTLITASLVQLLPPERQLYYSKNECIACTIYITRKLEEF